MSLSSHALHTLKCMKGKETLARLASMAKRQHGVVTRRQALAAGMTDRSLAAVVAAGVFRRDHHGVYTAVGTPTTPLTSIRAAMAAVGPDAIASHSTASWLAGLTDRPPTSVHVIVTGRHSHTIAGVEVHRTCKPPRTQVFQAVTCTAIPRTLVDLATCSSRDQLALAVDTALSRGLVRVADLEAEIGSGPRRGTAVLRSCLLERGDICPPDASVLEGQVARLFGRRDLPVPRAQVHAGPAGRFRIDYAYPDRLLAIEFNGYTWHHSPEQMARDLARQRALTLEGWLILVYSWKDVLHAGDKVAQEIATAYQQRRPFPFRR